MYWSLCILYHLDVCEINLIIIILDGCPNCICIHLQSTCSMNNVVLLFLEGKLGFELNVVMLIFNIYNTQLVNYLVPKVNFSITLLNPS